MIEHTVRKQGIIVGKHVSAEIITMTDIRTPVICTAFVLSIAPDDGLFGDCEEYQQAMFEAFGSYESVQLCLAATSILEGRAVLSHIGEKLASESRSDFMARIFPAFV